MSALDVEERPTDVTPTEAPRQRKPRSDAGKPRGPRRKLTPGELRAQADRQEAEERAAAQTKAKEKLVKAKELALAAANLLSAAQLDGGEAVRQWVSLMPGVGG